MLQIYLHWSIFLWSLPHNNVSAPAPLPLPPFPTPSCCMHTLGSFLEHPPPPPTSRLHTSVIPFSAIAGEKRMQVPHLHSLYRACARNANDMSKGRERGRQKSCKNARSFRSGQLKVFIWYWILALGDIFGKMLRPEMGICSDCLSFSHLNMCSALIVWSIGILKGGKISKDQVGFHS